MLFYTPEFILIAVVVLALFYCFSRQRLLVMALANLIFYGAAGPGVLALLIGVTSITYWCSRKQTGPNSKWFFATALTVNLANLLFFKYTLFFLTNLEALFSVPLVAELPWLSGLVLPLGLSFYTFQQIAYLVDVHQKKIEPARSWLVYWGFISFFALVLSGPIMRGKDLLPQIGHLQNIRFKDENLQTGALLFLVGLAKKIILADNLGIYADRFFAQGLGLSGAEAWVAAYLFTFQLYLDFSGYSDMALGIARMFGIRLTRNFATPYLSANATEFWRRWHITLSTWIRDYVYIPLGGNRLGNIRKYINLLLAMGISGLWHGAAWTFVVWGLYHGVLLVAHNIITKVRQNHPGINIDLGLPGKLMSIAIFFHLTCIGWVFFRIPDLGLAWGLVSSMLYPGILSVGPHLYIYLAGVLILFGLHILEDRIWEHRRPIYSWWQRTWPAPIRAAAYMAVILMVVFFLQIDQNSFIYFQF